MDENKTFVELALEELQKNDLEEYGQEIVLEEYLARELDIDLDTVNEKEKKFRVRPERLCLSKPGVRKVTIIT